MPAVTPQDLHREFEEAFNANDIDALMRLYEAECAVVPAPGSVAQGPRQVREALGALLAVGMPARLVTRDVVVAGDLALMSCRWWMGENAEQASVGGVTVEIARRQADGSWLFVIDNPVADQTIAAG